MENLITKDTPITAVVAKVLQAIVESGEEKFVATRAGDNIQIFSKKDTEPIILFSQEMMEEFVTRIKIVAGLKLETDTEQSGVIDFNGRNIEVKMQKVDPAGDYIIGFTVL